jgi:hypothetical protein
MKVRSPNLSRRISPFIVLLASLLVATEGLPSAARADTTMGMGGGGGKNIVQVINQTDNRLRVDGNVQLNRIPGPSVAPVNEATALSPSCVGRSRRLSISTTPSWRSSSRLLPAARRCTTP